MQKLRSFLALDASTELCSVALFHEGNVSHRQCDTPKSHAKMLLPMVDGLLADAGILPNQLQTIVVNRGPGSFTGIRIALSIAQGLAYGIERPLCAMDSLTAQAKYFAVQQGVKDGHIVAALDARMGEVYWSVFEVTGSVLRQVVAPQLTAADEFATLISNNFTAHSLHNEIATDARYAIGHAFAIAEVKQNLERDWQVSEQTLPHAVGNIAWVLDEFEGLSVRLLQAQAWASDLSMDTLGEISDLDPATILASHALEPLYLRNEITWEKRKRIRQSLPFENN